MIDPLEQPCLSCPDTPCITACTPGVLVRRDEGFPAMGLAMVSAPDCIAHMGTMCTACSERCPVPGAITLEQGRPVVVPEHCTGCGVCHHVCPAPRNAIILMPLRERPPRPSATDDAHDRTDPAHPG